MIPAGLCQCGCGERTKLATKTSRSQGKVKGQPQRFVYRHNVRGRFKITSATLRKLDGQVTPCWEWSGALTSGYGVVRYGGRNRNALVHRLAYESLIGPIPEGLVLDHLCRNRRCFNPWHVRVCTLAENTLAPGSQAIAAIRAAATHCVNGHPFDGENTYVRPGTGHRSCRTCTRLSRERRKEGVA